MCFYLWDKITEFCVQIDTKGFIFKWARVIGDIKSKQISSYNSYLPRVDYI